MQKQVSSGIDNHVTCWISAFRPEQNFDILLTTFSDAVPGEKNVNSNST